MIGVGDGMSQEDDHHLRAGKIIENDCRANPTAEKM
jgi:hypothetical protein